MTGLGIAAMAHAYDKDAFLEVFDQFKPKLQKMPSNELSCLLTVVCKMNAQQNNLLLFLNNFVRL